MILKKPNEVLSVVAKVIPHYWFKFGSKSQMYLLLRLDGLLADFSYHLCAPRAEGTRYETTSVVSTVRHATDTGSWRIRVSCSFKATFGPFSRQREIHAQYSFRIGCPSHSISLVILGIEHIQSVQKV